MPEIHLKQPEFIYSASAPFTKNKDRLKKLRKKPRRFQVHLSKGIR